MGVASTEAPEKSPVPRTFVDTGRALPIESAFCMPSTWEWCRPLTVGPRFPGVLRGVGPPSSLQSARSGDDGTTRGWRLGWWNLLRISDLRTRTRAETPHELVSPFILFSTTSSPRVSCRLCCRCVSPVVSQSRPWPRRKCSRPYCTMQVQVQEARSIVRSRRCIRVLWHSTRHQASYKYATTEVSAARSS